VRTDHRTTCHTLPPELKGAGTYGPQVSRCCERWKTRNSLVGMQK
jgi:hypothetical protein